MYEDIVHMALDHQLVSELTQPRLNYRKLPIWKQLQRADETNEMRESLRRGNLLNFESIFDEPVGYHCLKGFLYSQDNVDKV